MNQNTMQFRTHNQINRQQSNHDINKTTKEERRRGKKELEIQKQTTHKMKRYDKRLS